LARYERRKDNGSKRLGYLSTLDASSRELFLVASGAINFLISGYEALGADGRVTHDAAETFLVPLSGLVLHLFRS